MHVAVLKKEVIEYLDPKPNENFIDTTISEMGHTAVILEKNKPNGKVLGIEWDPELYKNLLATKIDRLILANDSYTNLKEIVEKYNFGPINGILFDLGMSSWHLEKSERGFSFMKNEILDMRYNPESNSLTAGKIINQWLESEITRILEEYGQEKFAKRVAREIIRERKIKPIKTTFELKEVIRKAVPTRYTHQKIHFATRTFQALRITVNDELNNLKKALPQAIEVLAPRGRIVIISFQSLEDKIVKDFFKKLSSEKLKILFKKPITPSEEEIKNNPRSRSAKLRAAVKI